MNAALTHDGAMRPCRPADAIDYAVALVLPLLIVVAFCVANTSLAHWCLLPLYGCGALVAVDTSRWARARMDTFDPKGLIGLLGVHFFLVAPLLVAHYDPEKVNDVYVTDWKRWLGLMGLLNLGGLILYRIVEARAVRRPTRAERRFWTFKPDTAVVVVLATLVFAVAAHSIFLVRLGGLSALVARRTYGESTVGAEVQGLGPLMAFGRSIPILVVILLTTWRYRRLRKSSNVAVVNGLMITAVIAQVFVAGLSGSRGATVWLLFWTVGIVHFFWRRISVSWILMGTVPLLGFMYLYSFYKNVGAESLELLQGAVSREALEAKTGRTFEGMLVGDLSRAHVQAGEVKVLLDGPWSYSLRYGSTYVTAIVSLVPRALLPDKTESGKVIAGTELFAGPGSYSETGRILLYNTGRRMTSIYGLAGEAMLNFGLWGVIPAFGVFGWIVGRVRRRLLSYSIGDARLLTAPFLAVVLLLLLTADVDNLAQQTLFNWVVPASVVYIISIKIAKRCPAAMPMPPGAALRAGSFTPQPYC